MSRKLFNLAAALAATLGGLWLGCLIRKQATGRSAQWLWFDYIDEEGRTYRSIPVSTKLWPAIFCAAVGRPRWLFGALGGVAAGMFVDDRWEARLQRWIVAHSAEIASRAANASRNVPSAMIK